MDPKYEGDPHEWRGYKISLSFRRTISDLVKEFCFDGTFSRILSISSHGCVILAQDKTTCANVTHMYQSPVFSWSRTRVNMGVICSFGSPLQLTKPKPACENLEMITINIFKVASIRRIKRILKQNNLNRAYTLNKMFL